MLTTRYYANLASRWSAIGTRLLCCAKALDGGLAFTGNDIDISAQPAVNGYKYTKGRASRGSCSGDCCIAGVVAMLTWSPEPARSYDCGENK